MLLFFIIFFCFSLDLTNGVAPIVKTIHVNKDGSGNFSSIQVAINSIPSINNEWIKIHVAAGVYREKVNITYQKNNIILEGEGYLKTCIEWGDYAGDAYGHETTTSATFTLSGSNFVAKGISFKNTKISLGVAAMIEGDKAAFYECGFYGFQDTLADAYNRHYFKNCFIEGAIDFIFGFARSIYERCFINIVPNPGGVGYVTAQGRFHSKDPGAFVFKKCTLSGKGEFYLGRAWKTYARVIFSRSFFPSTVVDQGWDAWKGEGHQSNIIFEECQCFGPGANLTRRVKWLKKLSPQRMRRFTNISFIDREGWISKQPIRASGIGHQC